MKYLSVCSGIEAATVAWHPLGWEAFAYSEIEKFPCKVLAHHYPNTPNLGDMTRYQEWPDAAIDVLVGGTPCQSFSIAGLREGLSDPRGNLMLTYLAIAAKYRPKWLVWENVPGVLSSNGGKDFASLLRGMAELGYGFSYRVLDAQYFGVAQRRRRVFVIGCLRDWRSAAAVLLERQSLSGHPAPSRKAGEKVTGAITAGAFNGGAGGRPEGAASNHFIAAGFEAGPSGVSFIETAPTLDARCKDGPIRNQIGAGVAYGISGNLINRQDHNGPNGSGISNDLSPTLTKTDFHAVAFVQNQRDEVRTMEVAGALAAEPGAKQQTYVAAHTFKIRGGCEGGGKGYLGQDDATFTITTGQEQHLMTPAMQVRRLTPTECERLQGFPDNYTLIEPNTPDGPRYKALGNSMAVPVMRWIGERIDAVEAIQRERVAA